MLAQAMGGAPGDDLVAKIQAETQGNPLFAKEIGQLLAAEGATARAGLPIPRGVLRGDRPAPSAPLEAVPRGPDTGLGLGREFDRTCSSARAPSAGTSSSPRSTRRHAGLVGDVPDGLGRLRFSHILVRDALYEDLPAPRRLRLHRAIAEALEELYAGNLEPHVAELAQHYGAAGPAAAEGDRVRPAGGRPGRGASSHTRRRRAGTRARSTLLETARSGDDDRMLRAAAGARRGAHAAPAAAARPSEACAGRRGARRAGRPSPPTRRAPTVGRFGWARASSDPALVPLLERALAAVGDGDSHARVRLLARLAAARRDEPPRERGSRSAARPWRSRTGAATRRHWRRARGYVRAIDGPDRR